MGYKAEPNRKKDGTASTTWRVIWRKQVAGKSTARHVKEAEYPSLGLHKGMSLEEAKAVLKQRNLTFQEDVHEARRENARKHVEDRNRVECANLPEAIVTRFETKHLEMKHLDSPEQLRRVRSHWETAKKVIRAVNLPTAEWADSSEYFFSYMIKNKVSWEYSKRLIRVINEWGYYVSRLTQTTYYPIPRPTANYRGKIQAAYHATGKTKESDPLTPEMLSSKKVAALREDLRNWLFLSVWLGMRPSEIDRLGGDNPTHKLTKKDGATILWVYQAKLTSLNPKDRWKLIPLWHPEQSKCLAIIESGNFKRPLAKTVREYFGPGVNCYGGRKGFTELMKNLGQTFDDVSQWLGHRSTDTTMRHYRGKNTVHWTPPKAA